MEDTSIQKAAEAIANADFILIGAGAGMSADSGLPVYATLSSHPVYQKLGLTFNQIVTPQMMVKNPALFYAHEISVQNLLCNAPPHEGYSILLSWKKKLMEKENNSKLISEVLKNEKSTAILSPTFIVTSNIDGHFEKVGFPETEIAQIHGCGKYWQCGGVPSKGESFMLFERGPCCKKLFEPPSSSEYTIDSSTLQATFSSGKQWPACKFCKDGIARPNTLMFGDSRDFVEDQNVVRTDDYRTWTTTILKLLKENPKLKLAIIEIGCGIRIPSIRKRCEEMLSACPKGQCELIRINPDYPDNKIIQSPTIMIKDTCLKSLKEMDSLMSIPKQQ